METTDNLERLKSLLMKLPGVGRRSASRMAVTIARNRDGYLKQLAAAIVEVGETVVICKGCGSLTPVEQNPCRLCTDVRRDDRLLCIVEDPGDIEVIERSGLYRGRYFALMGKLAPLRGETPQSLRLQTLWQRVGDGVVQEIILALNSDVESDATAHYLAEQMSEQKVKITRLARGIPAGSGLAYADPVTLEAALKNRTSL